MKIRLGIAIAAAMLGLAGPASATDVTANFTLDGVTFGDGGTASGGFTLDYTTGTLSNVNIMTTDGTSDSFGESYYTDTEANTFTNTSNAQFVFDDYYFIGEDILDINLGVVLTATNLATTPSFAIASGSEAAFFFLCPPPENFCASRSITAGSLDVSATPLPAALPLFAGGLGFVGYLARRKRAAAARQLSV